MADLVTAIAVLMNILTLPLNTILLRPYVFIFLAAFLFSADWCWDGAGPFFTISWITAFLCEFSSTRIGIPFGSYDYTARRSDKNCISPTSPSWTPSRLHSCSMRAIAWPCCSCSQSSMTQMVPRTDLRLYLSRPLLRRPPQKFCRMGGRWTPGALGLLCRRSHAITVA